MPAITEAQEKRIRQIQTALMVGQDLKQQLDPPFKRDDVKMLVDRVHELSDDTLSCADQIVQWARDRVEEDLREKRRWLEDAIENLRAAELMVREAEHALAALQVLKDGAIYQSGGEINERWDAVAALYRSQGMLPVPEPVEEAEEPPAVEDPAPIAEAAPQPFDQPAPVQSAQPPPEPLAQPAPASGAQEAPAPFVTRAPPPPSMPAEEQNEAIYAALKTAAGAEPQIQVSLPILAAESGVPKGSVHAVLRRLVDAGRIEIIVPEWVSGTKLPNIYRFIEAATETAPEAPPEPEPAPADPEPPVPAEEAAEKLAGAWGATVNRKPPKPTGLVSQSSSLRDRILATLGKAACTSSGLASMLDVKELAVCQTLDAMRHEGAVAADEMPEAGRRAQLWRLPPPVPEQAAS